jgi:hypothetical protein
MIIWKGFGRKLGWPNRGTSTAFTWKDWGKLRKTSILITTGWVEPGASLNDVKRKFFTPPGLEPDLLALQSVSIRYTDYAARSPNKKR